MSPIKEYKCSSCKAVLEFDPPSQKWKCHYCFNEYDRNELDPETVEDEQMLDEDISELESYNCKSCGAELITDSTISATNCLYCKSSAIIKARFSGRFKPKSLIPFKLTKEQAEEIYRKWIGKRIFAPTMFKTQEEIQKITGIYAPFWLFDCMVDGWIEGEGTRVSSWTQGDYRYTRTKFYRVARRANVKYRQIPVDASKKLDDDLMHKVEPYSYDGLTDFSLQYMSGFMAEKYDVEVDEAESVMKKRVEKYVEERLRGTVQGYSSYRVTSKQVNMTDKADSYSMLPVYVLIDKYKDKEHIFVINGQTGKIVGEPPISVIKQLVFGGAIFAAVWLLAVFGGALIV